ncbi:uncharacterized protein LOC101940897 [Chrysemys picta bellii]|uniref:uncharacterized protein LOC101940897 n=1 Tax=Chrysemys picta bellii TaxID=8478 RepID=UPI0032B102CF
MRVCIHLVFIVAALEGAQSQVLVESGGDMKKPGDFLRLSCKTSGFTFSSYLIDWIHLAPGKGLEWLARAAAQGSTYYADSVQGRFAISRDNANSLVHLQISSLRAEDTALYYWADVQLAESGGDVRKPRDSLCLSCKASGFPFSSYWMNWVHQAPGKGLVWLSTVTSDGSHAYYSPAVLGRFTISRDNSWGVWSQIQLIQSGAEVKKPGDSAKLSCKVSGYTYTSHGMHWARRAPGEGLEWVSSITHRAGDTTHYTDSVKGRFTISRDNTQNLLFLQMTGLKPEDTAVYYCARWGEHSDGKCTLAFRIFKGARSQVVLTQSGPALKKPGESHKLQCATSGFTLSSTWMVWIRQEPGKGLEWLTLYYSEGSKSYASSVQGRFTASKDSTNFYLQMTSLRAEDTAVYYCARDTVRGSESELRQKPSPAVTAQRVRC